MNISIKGINTNYFDIGSGEETVVMLHGWASNCELFRPSANAISVKYRVVCPDFPGMGETPEPPSVWTVDDYTDFVINFINALGLTKVILLGHSFGGRVIIKMANKCNLSFDILRIILVDSAGIKPEKSTERQAVETAGKIFKKLMPKKAIEKVQYMFGSDDYVQASPLMREILKNVVNEDLSDLLPGIKQNTLLIWGTADTSTPIGDAEKMEKLIPDAGLARMEGLGHFAFIQNPSLYIAILTAYFEI